MTQSAPSAKTDYSAAAKALMRRARHGILSTFSKQVPGYPFGSVLPCALTTAGEPILLISTLAAHTQNIAIDPHVSFTVIEPGQAAETQANARFTYLGVAEAVPADDAERLGDRFLSLVPSASMYISFGDFQLYTIRFTKGRFVGGFGAIGWVHSDSYSAPDPIAEMALARNPQIQMECQQSLSAIAQTRNASEAVLANADNQGIDIRLDGKVERIEYAKPLPNDTKLYRLIETIDETLSSYSAE